MFIRKTRFLVKKWQAFLQDLLGKGWGTTLKSRFPKAVSARMKNCHRNLVLFYLHNAKKCLLTPVKQYVRHWAWRKITRLHHLQRHFPPKSLFSVLVPKDYQVLGNQNWKTEIRYGLNFWLSLSVLVNLGHTECCSGSSSFSCNLSLQTVHS